MAGKVAYHVVGSNNLETAKGFYDALLSSIGMKGVMEHPSGGRVYAGRGTGMFAVLGAYDKNEATIGNGSMGGFSFDKGRGRRVPCQGDRARRDERG